MSELPRPSGAPATVSQALRVDQVCSRFEREWRAGGRPRIEDYLVEAPEPEPERGALLEQLLLLELEYRGREGEHPLPADYQARFPGCAERVEAAFRQTAGLRDPPGRPPGADGPGLPRGPEGATVESGATPPTTPAHSIGPPDWPGIPGYEVLGELGRGGMGVVYKVRQCDLQRLEAVKTLKEDALAGSRERALLRREAEDVARLRHVHIVQIYEFREHEGRPYIAMEFVAGGSLDRRLTGGPLPPRQAADLVGKLARAMHYAHEQSIVHRDLKPANVLLADDGSPKITDFGLAKHLENRGSLIESGALVGTPPYMAPEQALGESRDVGRATDVYALGAILYESLTGRPPFRAATLLETLQQVVSQEPVSPRRLNPAVARDLETICLKCLAKDPRQRYADAAALAEDLSAFLDGRPIGARPVGPLGHALKWAKRRPAVAALTGTLVGIILAALALVGWQWQAAVTARQDAERLVVRLALAQAENDGEKGEVGRALLWLDRALARIPREEKARRQAVLANLRAWSDRLHPLRGLLTHPDAIQGVAFSADGGTALTVTVDGTVRRWDTATGEPLGKPWKAKGPVRAVAFSPDGTTLVTAGDDGTVRLWEAATGKLLGEALPEHTDWARAVAFGPDGQTVVTGGLNGTVRLWKAGTLLPAGQVLLPKDGAVRALCLAPDGNRLLTVSRGGEEGDDTAVRLWAVADGKATLLHQLPHHDAVRAVAFSPDGASVLTGGEDHTAKLWAAADGELRHVFQHQDVVQAVAFSPDGKTVLTGSNDQTARLWDADTWEPIGPPLEHPGPVRAVALDRGGRAVLTGCRDQTARLWGVVGASSCLQTIRHDSAVMAVALSPDGTTLVTSTEAGKVYWRKPATGECRVLLPEHKRDVWAMAFSADGTLLVTGSRGTVRLWDGKDGSPKGEELSHRFRVRSVALDPRGSMLLTGSGDMVGDGDRTEGEARLYRVAARDFVPMGLAQPGSVWAVALSPDGKTCVIAAGENGAQLYDIATGQPSGPPLPHLNRVVAVAFSPDGRLVATGSTDKTARLWDAATGQPAGESLRHPGAVWSVAFSPNGETLVTGCRDGSARLWDTGTGTPVGPSWHHQAVVWAVACSPDGQTVVTGSADKTARLWQIPRPVADEPERITLWTKVITGMALDDHGVVHWLDGAAWQQCRQRLDELGGPPVP
jgi:WD40 repeat protein/tRNA A-37 threonylcarbamoyl transferase component Bud32